MLAIEGTEDGLTLTPILIPVNDDGGRIKRRKVRRSFRKIGTRDTNYQPIINRNNCIRTFTITRIHYRSFIVRTRK
jgi:hypothetical protein